MNTLIYILAVIGGLCVICTCFFLVVGIVNSIRAVRDMRKERKDV